MKIVWSENALHDLNEIRDYISMDSPVYALRVVERILDRVEQLGLLPCMGRVVPDAQGIPLREIALTPYRIIYKVESGYIGVVTIVHMARNWVVSDEDRSF